MGHIDSVTVDSEHPASLARFWASALEGYAVRSYDEAEIVSAIGTICSVYPGPLKVDWFIREGQSPDPVWIWSGAKPLPYDLDGHPWDWTWRFWGKVRRGQCELARTELSKLWQSRAIAGPLGGRR